MRAAFTTRYLDGADPGSGASAGAHSDLNLGFRCGDDPGKVSRNWAAVLDALGAAGKTLVIPRMVHGDALIDADALDDSAAKPQGGAGPFGETAGLRRMEPGDADALCSGSPRLALAVTMADCLTALVFDPECGTIAAVHAGWRGTHAHILEKSLRALADAGRIRGESALIAFGPCLRPGSLEMGAEVAARLEPEFVVRRGGKCYFDMPGSNRAQALAAGILPAHIRDMGGCTLTEPERFFSYRRDGQASGRMAACISLVGP
ncbi:MAG TPA: polyphenol oxidase family protein [Fibrobacteria bacterium]|nr:polyphenol oxidase family protein [Fibrobacteria bacterium]